MGSGTGSKIEISVNIYNCLWAPKAGFDLTPFYNPINDTGLTGFAMTLDEL